MISGIYTKTIMKTILEIQFKIVEDRFEITDTKQPMW